jgi:hypothetical protein
MLIQLLRPPYLLSGLLQPFVVKSLLIQLFASKTAWRIMADLESIQQKIISFRNKRDWAQFRDPLPRYIFLAFVATMLLMSAWLTSCSIPISYRDAVTYKNLTDLKAESMMLVETFDTKPFAGNEAAIENVTLEFRKALEYEKGKGKANNDTIEQLNKIQGLLNDDIKDYRENGNATLGRKYFQEAARVLGQAFDKAIETENLKNKDK